MLNKENKTTNNEKINKINVLEEKSKDESEENFFLKSKEINKLKIITNEIKKENDKIDEEKKEENNMKEEKKEENKKIKVLLMGKKGVGKTSIKSVIFENMRPQDTFKFSSTEEIEETHINYVNNILLDVLDFNSNESDLKEYLTTKKELFFSNADFLIFISDAQSQKNDEIKLFEE